MLTRLKPLSVELYNYQDTSPHSLYKGLNPKNTDKDWEKERTNKLGYSAVQKISMYQLAKV
jgi:hypothetical protein